MMDFDALSKEELKHFLKVALSSNQELKSDIDSLNDKVSELERIIELPITPFCIVCHKIMARHCRVCNRRVVASPDFSDRVVGKGRLGVRLLSQCQQMLYEKPPLASV